MADHIALPPDIMAALNKDRQFIAKAKDSVNEFQSFAGEDGRYYAKLRKVTITVDKTAGTPKFNFLLICLAKIPDAASSSSQPDQKHAGKPMRISAGTKATENQTRVEAWDRAMQQFQAFDIKTSVLGYRDGVLKEEFLTQDLWDMVCFLNENPPAVIVDVVSTPGKGKYTGKMMKNCNVREVVAADVVARFATPTMTVEDSEMPEIPDDEHEASVPTVEQAEVMIAGLDEAGLRQNMATEPSLKLPQPLGSYTYDQCKQIAIAFITQQPIPTFDTPPTTSNSQTKSTPSISTEQPSSSESSNDDEEEEEELPPEDPTFKVQLYVGTLDRNNLKKLIRSRGGRLPEKKFSPVETDDDLRQELFELITGKRQPVSAVVPDECPF